MDINSLIVTECYKVSAFRSNTNGLLGMAAMVSRQNAAAKTPNTMTPRVHNAEQF
jgi:hypothetical protein